MKTYEWFFHDYTDDSVNHFPSLDSLKAFIIDDDQPHLKAFIRADELILETVSGAIGVQCIWSRGGEQHMCRAFASRQGLDTELRSPYAILETP